MWTSNPGEKKTLAQALADAPDCTTGGYTDWRVPTIKELYSLIKDHDWCLASGTIFSGFHNVALWDHDRPYSYLGMYPAAALGYVLGSSTGAALAARGRDRIVINIQGDGDFNYTPGSIWTAAHHNLPMLTIMHNNRAYHMEVMYLQHVAMA